MTLAGGLLKHKFIFMNRLPLTKRVQILSMLCEGSSMRSISRVTDVSINTVTKLLVDAGETCLALHDELVRNVRASRIQRDEVWSRRPRPRVRMPATCGSGRRWTLTRS